MLTKKKCEGCGKEFESRRVNQRFCSPKCRNHSNYEANKAFMLDLWQRFYGTDRPPHPPRRCKCCGREFFPFRSWHKYCSDKCREQVAKENPGKTILG